MSVQLLNNLQAQLSQYGLDSKEWILKPLRDNIFEIFNCEDPNFKFIGEIEMQAWSRIWLESL